ncbi:hypothetical protein D1007_40336 [Hordeum vulgare]|nr:hypothetical protein D1007_40336 [Hordeum vulgare]
MAKGLTRSSSWSRPTRANGGQHRSCRLRPPSELSATSIALHLLALLSGLLPPLLVFFDAMLMHYHIHELHLDPRYGLLISSSAFLQEAFLGIPPTVVLLWTFFSLEMTTPDQCSGCVSFQAADVMAGECIDMDIDHFVECFRREWFFVDAGQYNPLLLTRVFADSAELQMGARATH